MSRRTLAMLAIVSGLGLSSLANAEMGLSQVIVDLLPEKPPREDIEVANLGSERMYVTAEPFEIQAPGTPEEKRVSADEPDRSGILVAPRRLVLEPGERRTVRIAAIGARSAADRVYRVAIKPVSGPVTAEASALKVLVGYDALVIVRPEEIVGDVVGERKGTTLILRNSSNTSHELFEGRQCDVRGNECRELPSKRLYPGATWRQDLPYATEVSYKMAIGPDIRVRKF